VIGRAADLALGQGPDAAVVEAAFGAVVVAVAVEDVIVGARRSTRRVSAAPS